MYVGFWTMSMPVFYCLIILRENIFSLFLVVEKMKPITKGATNFLKFLCSALSKQLFRLIIKKRCRLT